jgi:hypothetical protein
LPPKIPTLTPAPLTAQKILRCAQDDSPAIPASWFLTLILRSPTPNT